MSNDKSNDKSNDRNSDREAIIKEHLERVAITEYLGRMIRIELGHRDFPDPDINPVPQLQDMSSPILHLVAEALREEYQGLLTSVGSLVYLQTMETGTTPSITIDPTLVYPIDWNDYTVYLESLVANR